MEVHYDRVVIDPRDFALVHIVFTDDRDQFQQWLDENIPAHTTSLKERPVYYPDMRDREIWFQFGVKMPDEDIAVLTAAWPMDERDNFGNLKPR
jgi:hypothetical protein